MPSEGPAPLPCTPVASASRQVRRPLEAKRHPKRGDFILCKPPFIHKRDFSLNGVEQFLAGMHIELSINMRHVRFHGSIRQIQDFANIWSASTLGKHHENVGFSCRQAMISSYFPMIFSQSTLDAKLFHRCTSIFVSRCFDLRAGPP